MDPERLACGLVPGAVRRGIGHAWGREHMIARRENSERIPLGENGSFRLRLVWLPTKVDNIKVADTLLEQRDGDVHTRLRADRKRIAKVIAYGDFFPIDADSEVNRAGRLLSVRSGPSLRRQAEQGPHAEEQG